MKILFNTLGGSKLYGTNTPESDTDYKTVFLPNIKSLLVVKGVKNIANTTGNDMSKNSKDDIDHEYIPIQILAKDFLKGQTYALEIVFSALYSKKSDDIEILDSRFYEFCQEISVMFLTSDIKAMLGYAYGQTHKYGIKGVRFQSVLLFKKLLINKLEEDPSIIDKPLRDTLIYDEIKQLNDKYLYVTVYDGPYGTEPCISLIEKIYPLDIKYSEAISRTSRLVESYGSRTKKSMDDGGIDWKAVSHAVRITYQAIDILDNTILEFPLNIDRINELKDIKAGKYEWIIVEEKIEQLMNRVDLSKKMTRLPRLTDNIKERFDVWLEEYMLKFYDI